MMTIFISLPSSVEEGNYSNISSKEVVLLKIMLQRLSNKFCLLLNTYMTKTSAIEI